MLTDTQTDTHTHTDAHEHRNNPRPAELAGFNKLVGHLPRLSTYIQTASQHKVGAFFLVSPSRYRPRVKYSTLYKRVKTYSSIDEWNL